MKYYVSGASSTLNDYWSADADLVSARQATSIRRVKCTLILLISAFSFCELGLPGAFAFGFLEVVDIPAVVAVRLNLAHD